MKDDNKWPYSHRGRGRFKKRHCIGQGQSAVVELLRDKDNGGGCFIENSIMTGIGIETWQTDYGPAIVG